jgi:hypothetical protein
MDANTQKGESHFERCARKAARVCQSPVTGTVSQMSQAWSITLCGICGAEVCREGAVCLECQRSFEAGQEGETVCETGPLDLRKYDARMFPWEQMPAQPRLISVNPVWLIFALGLVVLVLLLALIRTPLPSCWELSP